MKFSKYIMVQCITVFHMKGKQELRKKKGSDGKGIES